MCILYKPTATEQGLTGRGQMLNPNGFVSNEQPSEQPPNEFNSHPMSSEGTNANTPNSKSVIHVANGDGFNVAGMNSMGTKNTQFPSSTGSMPNPTQSNQQSHQTNMGPFPQASQSSYPILSPQPQLLLQPMFGNELYGTQLQHRPVIMTPILVPIVQFVEHPHQNKPIGYYHS